MCVQAIAAVAGIASSIVGAFGAIQSANAQAAQAEYQAKVDSNNAILAQRSADDAKLRGAAEEEKQRTKNAQLKSRQRAVLAAGGIDISSGSPLDVVSDTAEVGELDALTVRGNFEREALEHLARKSNFQASAELSRMRASAAQNAGPISALGSILGGVGTVASNWYRMKVN